LCKGLKEVGVNRISLDVQRVTMQIDPLFLKLRKIFTLSEAMYLARSDFEELKDFFGKDVNGLVARESVEEAEAHDALTETGRFWAGNISTLFSRQIAKLIKGQH
jgi:coproporphyrinogen III oxidase-like Fe-S oxidoreductase